MSGHSPRAAWSVRRRSQRLGSRVREAIDLNDFNAPRLPGKRQLRLFVRLFKKLLTLWLGRQDSKPALGMLRKPCKTLAKTAATKTSVAIRCGA
jgi:hypothetical protein